MDLLTWIFVTIPDKGSYLTALPSPPSSLITPAPYFLFYHLSVDVRRTNKEENYYHSKIPNPALYQNNLSNPPAAFMPRTTVTSLEPRSSKSSVPEMGVPSDDAVLIQKGKKPGDPYVITVNCPDKTGLGCDICRTILEFGLYVIKGDVSTDGIWCYVVLWVVPHSMSPTVRWSNLKERLLSICPSSFSVSFYLNQPSPRTSSTLIYMLTLCSLDRKELLHDVTQVLSDLELNIERVKVTTTPDGRVLDLFFISDNLQLLHTKRRQEATCEQLQAVLGESCISCELQLAGLEYDSLPLSSLPPAVAEELFRCELSEKEERSQALSSDVTKLKKTSVLLDNSLSPAHTLLQINCVDHKGFLYDIMRTLKDFNIQIAHGRFSPVKKGYRELDLFIRQKDSTQIVDVEKQEELCSRLKMEMLHPLRVIIANRGPDTELFVANPVELSGKGRPSVFYDVTLALKTLGICIFSAEIGRHSTSGREWEIYRFLLEESSKFHLWKMVVRNQIVDKVRRTLMGW